MFFKRLQSHQSIQNLVSIVIILNCFFYPITAVIIAYFNVPSNSINIGLKFFYLNLAVIVIVLAFLKNQVLTLPINILGAISFFIIYSIRLIVDLSFLNVEILEYSTSYVYAYFFGATLVPIIAIIIGHKYINVETISRFTFYTLAIANIFLVYYLLVIGDFGDLERQLAMRAHIKSEGATVGTLINPILIGYFGASLALFCFNSILVGFFRNKFLNILLYPLMGLGVLVLLLGASRGPFIGLIFMIILSLVTHFYRSKEKLIKISKAILISSLIFFSFKNIVSEFLNNNEVHLIFRMEKFFKDREKGRIEARDLSFEGAIQDFLDSPIIGKQFVGTFDNFYPHNIFIEVLMATGLIGGIAFLHYFINYLISIHKITTHRDSHRKIPLLFACLLSFFLGFTSGSIFGSPDIWILMTLVILIVKK